MHPTTLPDSGNTHAPYDIGFYTNQFIFKDYPKYFICNAYFHDDVQGFPILMHNHSFLRNQYSYNRKRLALYRKPMHKSKTRERFRYTAERQARLLHRRPSQFQYFSYPFKLVLYGKIQGRTGKYRRI